MIILDTNVLSELMRNRIEPSVLAWLDDRPSESIWTTSVTVFEVRFGLERVTAGRQRRRLEDEFTRVLEDDLESRVLPFDLAAADAAGAIAASQRLAGRPVEIRDVQIAGIVSARKGTLATRNARHFEGIGLSLVNPWSA